MHPTATATRTSTQLLMCRPTLDGLPALPELPEGFILRTYRPMDCAPLAALLTRAFNAPWDEALVRSRLAEAPDVEAIYLVVHGRDPVATASARVGVDAFPRAGYVHWVAADPAYRRQGWGRLATLRVLHHFRDTGLPRAVLETDDCRLPALRTYLQLGFVPEYREPGDQARWSRLFPLLLQREAPA